MMSNIRRTWSLVGERALIDQKQGFDNRYLYSAINPLTGEDYHLLGFTDMDSDTEFAFLTGLKRLHPDIPVFVVVNNAPSHRSEKVHSIEGLELIHLPPYSPELNPSERYFEEIRRDTCNTVFTTMEDIETRISESINKWTKGGLMKLTGYDWIKEQCGVVS